jgi:CheY-like chemotaxis protein
MINEIRTEFKNIFHPMRRVFKERYSHIPEDQEVSSIMIQEVDRLNRVVSQLLAFAKPVTVAKLPVSISEVIHNTLKLMERQTHDCQIDIETNIQPELPLIHIDPDQISQVLLKLFKIGLLMDVRMLKVSGLEALSRIKAINPAIPVIIMTAYSSAITETLSLTAVEKSTILSALASADGNKSLASRKLGITRKTLHKKLKEYGVMP